MAVNLRDRTGLTETAVQPERRERHVGQLDGIRALAIIAVIAYHLGYLSGGWIGVDVFFVLSGFLITSILLSGRDRTNSLWSFWGRRARRLLPAVLLLVLVLAVYAWIGGPGIVPAQLRSPGLATLFYIANWQQVIAGHSYFNQYTAASALQHTWSLAIEEQYYLVWPLMLAVMRFRSTGRRSLILSLTFSLGVASAVWMGIAAHVFGANRAYLGTDTRAWELLLGGGLAMIWPLSSAGAPTTRSRALWALGSGVGAAVLIAGALLAGGPPRWIWDGGLVGIALGAAMLIVGSLRAPDGPVARVLRLAPAIWIGTVSYSLYLWHWPVIVLITHATTGLSPAPLLAARLAAMLVAATISYYVVERPLRRFDWSQLGQRLRVPLPSFAFIGVLLVFCVTSIATEGPAAAQSGTVALPQIAKLAAAVQQPRLNVPPASLSKPYRAWILGDSVMVDSSPGLTAALEATGEVTVVANTAFPGWGLGRDAEWPADAERTIATYHPQIVIGTWSWDDQEARQQPVAYARRLEAAIGDLLSPANGVAAVVMLQFPVVGPAPDLTDPSAQTADWRDRSIAQDSWNNAARAAAKAFPGRALYLTTSQLFAPAGRYYTWYKTASGKWVRARKLDNTHMCPYGAAAFGALVTEEMAPQLELGPIKPGWEFGQWTKDPRFNSPPGACPNDQPPKGYSGVPVPHVVGASP